MAKYIHSNLTTAGLKPQSSEIGIAEIAINTEDGILYTKQPSGDIITVGNILVVDNIEDLPSIVNSTKLTTIVTNSSRGGTFHYDSSKSGINDGGIIFDGWVREYDGSIQVKWFGAVGDGVTDSGTEINLALSYLRDNQENTLEFGSGKFVTSISLNATLMNKYSAVIQNAYIIGKCTDKVVLDFTGCRGMTIRDVTVEGDITDTPSVGIQFARSSETGFNFCDNALLSKVNTSGYFAIVATWFYAQESSLYSHCKFWNSNPNGQVSFHIGDSNGMPPYVSEFTSILTGPRSFIQNKYINMDYRYLPSGSYLNISDISLASEAVVTTFFAHPYSTGDILALGYNETSRPSIDNQNWTITVLSSTTFRLDGGDTTGDSGAYTDSGSCCIAMEKSPIVIGRMNQHNFDNCYTVAYGAPAIEMKTPGLYQQNQLDLDFLVEGFSIPHHFYITGIGSNYYRMKGIRIKGYSTKYHLSFIGSDASSGGTISIPSGSISLTSKTFGSDSLFDDLSKYRLSSFDVSIPTVGSFDYSQLQLFKGCTLHIGDENARTYINSSFEDSNNGTFIPTIGSTVGTINSSTVNSAIINYQGNIVTFNINITIDDVGTASGGLQFTLPIEASSSIISSFGGRNQHNGNSINCIGSNSSYIIYNYDNTSVLYNGSIISMGGTFINI